MNARDRRHCIRTIETLRALRDEHCPYCHEDDNEIGPCESDCYVSERETHKDPTMQAYVHFGNAMKGEPCRTVRVDLGATDPPRGKRPRQDGYGTMTPTCYRVRITNPDVADRRWRRVYRTCWSNLPTYWCIVDGERRSVQLFG